MVKIMENPIKMDDLGGKKTIFGNTHIVQSSSQSSFFEGFFPIKGAESHGLCFFVFFFGFIRPSISTLHPFEQNIHQIWII